MQELTLLNEKLNTLLKKYAELQAENKQLKQTIDKHEKTVSGLNTRIAELEEHTLGNNIGNAVQNDTDKEVMKKQLDTVISEIDKILATLND
ncbi:MAG: hypothetical protein JST82_05215 [Bacteroidetes bacterium]|nr:hypothetical protein [Bacteroidota bacterium]